MHRVATRTSYSQSAYRASKTESHTDAKTTTFAGGLLKVFQSITIRGVRLGIGFASSNRTLNSYEIQEQNEGKSGGFLSINLIGWGDSGIIAFCKVESPPKIPQNRHSVKNVTRSPKSQQVHYSVKPQNTQQYSPRQLSRLENQKQAQIETIKRISQPHKEEEAYVAFYKSGPSGFLSNFAHTPLTYDGENFECAEAAFQWKKVMCAAKLIKDSRVKAKVLIEAQKFYTANGEEAYNLQKTIFQRYSLSIHPKWDTDLRVETMYNVLVDKFEDPHLQELLLATGDSYLLEHRQETASDTFWSDGHYGNGANKLGELLMELRADLGGGNPEESIYFDTQYYSNLARGRHPALTIHEGKTYWLPQ